MKILITGAAGMLAAEVIPALLKAEHNLVQTDINRRLPDIEALDVSDAATVLERVLRAEPDYIFHLAAETNVDLCEKEPDHAFKVNAEGTENIVKACKASGAGLVYISTGNVFNGEKKTPFIESDVMGGCVNIYGRSKLRGEEAVVGVLTRYFIIRAGWMVGGWELDKKFVYKIIQQLKNGKKELIAVSDKVGTPTFTRDFAANLINVVSSKKYGLYHMANKGTCSRYDMAVKIVEYMGLAGKVKVDPVDSSRFPLPAPRPYSEMLENRNLELMGLNNMPHWEESLRIYIEENRNKK